MWNLIKTLKNHFKKLSNFKFQKKILKEYNKSTIAKMILNTKNLFFIFIIRLKLLYF